MDTINETCLYFDIETTGLSPEVSAITVIGCIDIYGNIKQWFNEDGFQQEQILADFLSYASSYNTLVSYNGRTFDVPFLESKIKEYQLKTSLKQGNHIDLYQVLRPYSHLFHTTSMKQRNMESTVGYKRSDQLSGKKVIKVYQDYIKTKDSKMKDLLLLHNHDDLIGLAKIGSLLAYISLEAGGFNIVDSSITKEKLSITLTLNNSLPKELSITKDNMSFVGNDKKGILEMIITDGQLRHYYPNPKDYYYLPLEDIIVPKSMATFVNKENREKALPSNCYSKFQGREAFLQDKEALYTFCKDTIYYLFRKEE